MSQGLAWRGGMVSAATSMIFASLISLCELNTHWMKRFGWQLWFMNLAMLPMEPASMQYSGAWEASESCSSWRDAICSSEPDLCCRKITSKHHGNDVLIHNTWHCGKGRKWQLQVEDIIVDRSMWMEPSGRLWGEGNLLKKFLTARCLGWFKKNWLREISWVLVCVNEVLRWIPWQVFRPNEPS